MSIHDSANKNVNKNASESFAGMPNVQLKRSDRRSLAITIDKSVVVVRAPRRMSFKRIEQFVRSKHGWIEQKVLEQQVFLSQVPVRTYKQGDSLPFMGEQLQLKLSADKARIKRAGSFLCFGERHANPATLVQAWYRKEAEKILVSKVQNVAEQLGVKYNSVKFRKTKSRWGHCTSAGVLQFNWLIVLASEPVVDYLVAHEVCHLLQFDHSPRFWSLVESVCSDYREQKQWLRDQGHTLVL